MCVSRKMDTLVGERTLSKCFCLHCLQVSTLKSKEFAPKGEVKLQKSFLVKKKKKKKMTENLLSVSAPLNNEKEKYQLYCGVTET